MKEILLGGRAMMLLFIAIPPCLTIDTPAYYSSASLKPEKNVKFKAGGDQFYDLPQLKDFGLTKTPGHRGTAVHVFQILPDKIITIFHVQILKLNYME